jgi:hypothetical protein
MIGARHRSHLGSADRRLDRNVGTLAALAVARWELAPARDVPPAPAAHHDDGSAGRSQRHDLLRGPVPPARIAVHIVVSSGLSMPASGPTRPLRKGVGRRAEPPAPGQRWVNDHPARRPSCGRAGRTRRHDGTRSRQGANRAPGSGRTPVARFANALRALRPVAGARTPRRGPSGAAPGPRGPARSPRAASGRGRPRSASRPRSRSPRPAQGAGPA